MKYEADETGTIIAGLVYLGIGGTLAVGWVFNVMSIWHSIDNPLTAKFILRCIGVFVFPVGGILGYL
jgi:hypothetical protein